MGKIGNALKLEAEKRKPRTILPKEKRLQPKKKAPDSPSLGKTIQESEYWPPPPLPNKEDFKYWKPWLVEQNVPNWVEDL